MPPPLMRLFFTVLVVFFSGAGETSPQCRNLLDSGDLCYKRFDNVRALAFYRGVHEQCPTLYEGVMKMTRALLDHGEDLNTTQSDTFFIQSLRYADTMQRYYPDSGQAYFLKALAAANFVRLKSKRQRFTYASIIFSNVNKSIELMPSFSPGYVLLGVYYREVASMRALDRLLARMFLGRIPEGTLDDSRRVLEKALGLSRQNIGAHLELAKTEIAMHNVKRAIELLKETDTLPAQWHGDAAMKKEERRLLEKLVKQSLKG